MNDSFEPTLKTILARLMNEFQPAKIVLFGSRAKGTNQSDSDYDLVVVVKSSNEDWLERSQRAYKVLRGCGASVDVTVVTESEYNDKVQQQGSIYQIASDEGLELPLG